MQESQEQQNPVAAEEFKTYRNDEGMIISEEAFQELQAKKEEINDPLFIGFFTTRESFILVTQGKTFEEGAWAFIDDVKVVLQENQITAEEIANLAAANAVGLGDDVKFTSASPFTVEQTDEEKTFNPVQWLVEQMQSSGVAQEIIDRITGDVHNDAQNMETACEHRLFLTNRALRLVISESDYEDTIQLRMLISDKVSLANWKGIITAGLIPALLGKLPRKA